MPKKTTLAIVSGGLDSTTLAYFMAEHSRNLHILTFNYHQRHVKEIEFAHYHAKRLQAEFHLVNIRDVGMAISGNALTGGRSVPLGHYEAENMKVTVVPNRNAIFLSIAFGVAAAIGAKEIGIGVHAGDHHIYRDCRPEFIEAFCSMEQSSLEDPPLLFAPFLGIKKEDIVRAGTHLHVPYEQTWSCYKGGDIHCGGCGTCVERKEAFQLAGVEDPTEYQD